MAASSLSLLSAGGDSSEQRLEFLHGLDGPHRPALRPALTHPEVRGHGDVDGRTVVLPVVDHELVLPDGPPLGDPVPGTAFAARRDEFGDYALGLLFEGDVLAFLAPPLASPVCLIPPSVAPAISAGPIASISSASMELRMWSTVSSG